MCRSDCRMLWGMKNLDRLQAAIASNDLITARRILCASHAAITSRDGSTVEITVLVSERDWLEPRGDHELLRALNDPALPDHASVRFLNTDLSAGFVLAATELLPFLRGDEDNHGRHNVEVSPEEAPLEVAETDAAVDEALEDVVAEPEQPVVEESDEVEVPETDRPVGASDESPALDADVEAVVVDGSGQAEVVHAAEDTAPAPAFVVPVLVAVNETPAPVEPEHGEHAEHQA
jgi:hypothetical protein